MNRLAEEYKGDVYVHYVDIDNRSNRSLVNRYGARSIPFIVILNDEGKIVTTFRGVTSERTLRAALEQALAASTGVGSQRG
ncbi:MAG: thioredoxin family protein [Chloroflexi bacterium]|nr:thioredoxin family protein [Chloroflexota bacterium]